MFFGQSTIGGAPVGFDPATFSGSIYPGIGFLLSHYQPVPLSQNNWMPWFTLLARATNNELAGKLNALNTVTLTANATTTTLTDSRIGAGSFIHLQPQTAHAAAEQWWISNFTIGSCTINHSNTTTTDRTFNVLIIGGMTTRAYQPVPVSMSDWLPWGQLIARATNNILMGKMNATVPSFTVATGTTTTTLTDSRISATSHIGFMPQTAHAATELPNVFVTNQAIGSATINHSNAATGDRTYTLLIIG